MNGKNIFYRFIPLALAILFICMGCGVAPEYKTDIETPDVVLFASLDDAFTVTNKEGHTLFYDGENVSGSMEVFEQKVFERMFIFDQSEYSEFYAQLPYSSNYVYERIDGLAQLDVGFFAVNAFLPSGGLRNYFTVRSSGILKRVEYDGSGKLYITGDKGAMLDITTAMPCDMLGTSGFVKLASTSVQEEISLSVQDSTLSFSGLEPGYITLIYGGKNVVESRKTLELTASSGTIELSEDTDSKIVVTVDSPDT